MDDWQRTMVWLLLAISLAAVTLSGLAAQSLPFIPALLCVIAAACAVHTSTRRQVMTQVVRAFSGSALRSALIVVGAVMLIQLLPLEMAFLLAGDVLVYLEAVTAVSLLSVGARLRPVRTAIITRLAEVMTRLNAQRRNTVRAIRTVRTARQDLSKEDDPDRAWAFA